MFFLRLDQISSCCSKEYFENYWQKHQSLKLVATEVNYKCEIRERSGLTIIPNSPGIWRNHKIRLRFSSKINVFVLYAYKRMKTEVLINYLRNWVDCNYRVLSGHSRGKHSDVWKYIGQNLGKAVENNGAYSATKKMILEGDTSGVSGF